jgi:hypothetical protein
MANSAVRRFRQDLMERITAARREYQVLDRSISETLALGTSRPGRAKRKLHLPMPELVLHMEQRESRAKLQHRLRVMVPVERALRTGLQQNQVFAPTSPHVQPLVNLLTRRAAGNMPAAFDEAQSLFAKHPDLFGPMPSTLQPPPKKAKDVKAQTLHAKLLASGLLTPEETVTLRLVFSQYRA